jgi:hypothetical protein
MIIVDPIGNATELLAGMITPPVVIEIFEPISDRARVYVEVLELIGVPL